MGRADSPLRGRTIFAYGAQRSGTWWLQRMLVSHPQVSAIPSETYLFEKGIRPLLDSFHHGVKSSTTVGQMYADRELLLDATRDFCDRVIEPYLEPGARYVCERSPGHAKAAALIAEVYPDARLVHIVRDGRDVARSLAARSWGPESISDAAAEWRDSVIAGRAPAGGPNYLELRYEELLADLEGGLRRLYEWLELPAGDDVLAQALVDARKPLNEDPKDPRVTSGKWRDHFSADDVAAFDAVAGELLAELGYAHDDARPREDRRSDRQRGVIRRARARVASLRSHPAAANGNGAPEIGGRLADLQSVGDRLLASLHQGDAARIQELLRAGATLRVVSGESEQRVSGADAVAEALLADSAWSAKQRRGSIHPGDPSFSFVLEYETPSGPAWRSLYFAVRDGGVETLTVYQIDS